MIKIPIKPLSVNDAWQGRRYKTKEYKQFERDVKKLLKPLKLPTGLLCLRLEFGFSSLASDWDNPIKPFVDILQKKYGFNDNRIKIGVVAVNNDVKKGEDYIKFSFESVDNIKGK